MEKSNVEHLKDIIKELEIYDSGKASEAEEFLESIKDELDSKDDKIKELEDEADDDDEEPEYDNSDFVGLDTIHWSLENGNLNIEQKMEAFINNLKRQNAVVPA